MTDKEIGELWRWHGRQPPSGFGNSDIILSLIRKLVEERKELSYRRQGGRWLMVDLTNEDKRKWLDRALRDFGIDPETFK
jgi:hypothetical protein